MEVSIVEDRNTNHQFILPSEIAPEMKRLYRSVHLTVTDSVKTLGISTMPKSEVLTFERLFYNRLLPDGINEKCSLFQNIILLIINNLYKKALKLR